jgi:ABC-type molybdate transport system ATPase subunit
MCVLLGAYFCLSSSPLVAYLCCRADVELNVPAIAVLGWQSAGKSSLVEAISGITLPRAGGTCTR